MCSARIHGIHPVVVETMYSFLELRLCIQNVMPIQIPHINLD